ncbi:MAG TPA: APC family permease [Terriglobales bacterium]|nr:APC family permease [Terriglobales bacterium]
MATDQFKRPAQQVFVATTVMLTFISFWRAAAIVLSDLASSAYYAPGIAEAAIGKSAPWLILAVMVFSYGVRALYIESSTMFVRGGVYRVVKEAIGGTLAKIAVSALMFDFLLTGPISAVSAGQYVAGFVVDLSARLGHPWHVSVNAFSVVFALAVTIYFWWKNVQGIHESSEKALRIMQITTVMVVILIGWSLWTIYKTGFHLPPLPTPRNMTFTPVSLGWLLHTGVSHIAVLALLIGFGHSVLAMSGEETLAQVYREIESPKVKNLEKTAMVIFVYTLVFTSLAAFFAVMIVPDAVRRQHLLGNLLGVLAMYLAGPYNLRLVFQGFVVLVGALILSGAVNTAIIGSNGVLNRVSEDGVLAEWFRKPHPRYGTTGRIINLIVGLQIVIILITRGNVDLLGEGYAFGLIWSFTFLAVSVLVLRFTAPEGREWRIPLNFTFGKTEIPLGAALITLVLFSTAVMNLFTKEIATIAGGLFTAAFFVLFVVSERATRRRQRRKAEEHLDQFRVRAQPDVAATDLQVRPGNVLVAVRDPNALYHLRYILERTDTTKQDVVVMTAQLYRGPFVAPLVADEKQVFNDYEQELFTRVVAVAEKAGKKVSLLVVPGTDVFQSIVVTAQRLESSTIVAGLSQHLSAEEQGKFTGDAWERLPEPRPRLTLEIVGPDGLVSIFHLGPHTPRLRAEDLELLHNLWLELTTEPEYRGLHHYDVIALALKELQQELHGDRRPELMQELEKLSRQSHRDKQGGSRGAGGA